MDAAVERLERLIEEYGAIPEGENPFRDLQVPKRSSRDMRVSQTVRTILEAKATPDFEKDVLRHFEDTAAHLFTL